MAEKDEGDLVTNISNLASFLYFCREYRHVEEQARTSNIAESKFRPHKREKAAQGGRERPYTNSIVDGLDAVASD
jgi:hypothetical protein